MKYVRLDVTFVAAKMKRKYVFPFANDLSHSMMAGAMKAVLQADWPAPAHTVDIVSAGEIDVEAGATWGRSVSLLGLLAKEEDAEILNTTDYSGHVEAL